MTSSIMLRDDPVQRQPSHAAALSRDITFADSLDYDAIPEDALDDVQLDRTSVLTADVERRLFTQMNRAYYFAATQREQWRQENANEGALNDIVTLLARGDVIRNKLLVIFHKLSVSIAKHFVSPRHTLEELTSEGDATLLRAITLFDPGRGFRFSTYATHSLRRRFSRYVNSSAHRQAVPVDFRETPPIPDECRWTPAYEQAMWAGAQWLESALYELTSRERYILRCRYGWGREFEPRTLQEIAGEFGISRERVRQLEARSLKKLQALAGQLDLVEL